MHRKALLVLISLAISAAAWADDDDPPSRVARLNYQSGSVSFRPGSVEEWGPATLNYPLTSGDHLWADAASQTEIHVGSTAIRMAPLTAMSILNLDDRTVQLSLTEGALHIRIRNMADDESYEVDTPNIAVTLLRPGDYRIEANGDNSVTIVTVRGGDAEVSGGGAAFPVHARRSARISGVDSVSQEMLALAPPDEFDRWCEARERREQQAQISARYVPRDMVGYEDLDEYGVWTENPQYGWVWTPRGVAVGWAPYHDGHWAWVEPWGWTWIDDAPWGFAPFHYGRWAFAGSAWVWVPGRMVVGVRPVYAPALVAFVGGGGFGVSVGVGGGVAAWFPLGPGEVYRPAYHVSEVYVRQVNITHVTNVNVINVTNVRYVNQNVVGAVTVVPHAAFVSARPVSQVAMRVDAREVAQARVIGTTAAVAPVRESIVVRSPANVAAPPARLAQRTVVVRNSPPPPPVSFAAKQQALQANQGRPLEPAQVNTLRTNAPPPRPVVRTLPSRQPQPNAAQPAPQPSYTPPPGRNERPINLRPPQPVVQQEPRTERPAVVAPRQEQPAAAGRNERPESRAERPPQKGERRKDDKKKDEKK